MPSSREKPKDSLLSLFKKKKTGNIVQSDPPNSGWAPSTQQQQPPAPEKSAGSTTGKTVLNFFTMALDMLGSAPIPGIGVATKLIVHCIKHSTEASENNEKLAKLADELQFIGFLFNAIPANDENESDGDPYFLIKDQVLKEVEQIGRDIQNMKDKGLLHKFLSSTDQSKNIFDYVQKFINIRLSMTFIVAMQTQKDVKQLETEVKKAISEARARVQSDASSDDVAAVAYKITATQIINRKGKLGVRNEGNVQVEMNVGGLVDNSEGEMFTGNIGGR